MFVARSRPVSRRPECRVRNACQWLVHLWACSGAHVQRVLARSQLWYEKSFHLQCRRPELAEIRRIMRDLSWQRSVLRAMTLATASEPDVTVRKRTQTQRA